MIPHWQAKHDWWIEDIKFDLAEIWAFKLMIRKVVGSGMEKPLFKCLRGVEGHLKGVLKDYAKIYGHRPNIRRMRDEIEKEANSRADNQRNGQSYG